MSTAFEGLRVLDLSDRLSGAFAARLFGDFGADVILAEPPEGHLLRLEPPFLNDQPGANRSTIHAYANWNKRSVVVESNEQIASLIASSDIVITTADPLSKAIYTEGLRQLSSDAVHLSITAHGLDTNLSGRPGNNLTACARTGWSFVNNFRDEPPLQMPRHQSGYVGGIAGFIAAAAALRRRNHGLSAELVDVSEVSAFALTIHVWSVGAVYHDAGFSFGAGGRFRAQPRPLWNLSDGRMHFAIADFHNWMEAMNTLGLPEIAKDEELIPDIGRHAKNLMPVATAMQDSLKSLERWPVFHKMMKLRCVSGVFQDIDDIAKNEQLLARDFLEQIEIEGKAVRTAGAPAKLSPSPWRISKPAPSIGEHTTEVISQPALRQPKSSPSQQWSDKDLAEGPLAGVRVLSFGQAWSGTFGTELFALLGADVVQIGSLHRPDVFRRMFGAVPAGVVDDNRTQHPPNTQGHYNSVNLHKREVTLDLRTERGRELLWELLPRFDILADNFRPTVLPSWGVTLEKLHDLRPGMIWASISGYGETGPYWDYPANGATTEPMAGLASIHGNEGESGMNTGGLYPDPVAGYLMVATVMAALHHRDKTGEPQRIDLSMMEAINAMCGDAVIEYDATGRVPGPIGNRHPRIAPHNHYQTSSGEWLALATENEAAWQALVGAIGDARLQEPRFEDMASRKQNETALDTIIGAWCSQQNAVQLEEIFGQKGITAARVRNYYNLYSEPEPDFKASGFVTQIEHPEAGLTWLPGRPWRYSAATATPVRHAPCIGQHSREILVDELGISSVEYDELVKAGITGTLDDVRD
ncbi:MAG: CoA transferase [Pseudomonadota bacterium]